MPSVTFSLPLNRPATHVDVRPGGTVILRGSFHSTHDGSTVDAATTTWPSAAPGGGSVDQGGLIDFESGGFHVVSRDPQTHEVTAVATDDAAPACAAYGVQAPCLPLRVNHQATSRLITVNEWVSSFKGGIVVEVPTPPVYAPVTTLAEQALPVFKGAGLAVLLVLAVVAVAFGYRRWRTSPAVQLKALAKRVREKAIAADPILSAPLAPALEAAVRAVRDRRIQASSTEGRRVEQALRAIETRLDDKVRAERADDERQAADALVHQVEVALEAAQEASVLGRQR